MNWVGGNLHRHSRGGRSFQQRQKAHFAKVRSSRRGSSKVTKSPVKASQDIARKHSRALRSRGYPITLLPRRSNNRSEPCDEDEYLDATRKKLLENDDWLGLDDTPRDRRTRKALEDTSRPLRRTDLNALTFRHDAASQDLGRMHEHGIEHIDFRFGEEAMLLTSPEKPMQYASYRHSFASQKPGRTGNLLSSPPEQSISNASDRRDHLFGDDVLSSSNQEGYMATKDRMDMRGADVIQSLDHGITPPQHMHHATALPWQDQWLANSRNSSSGYQTGSKHGADYQRLATTIRVRQTPESDQPSRESPRHVSCPRIALDPSTRYAARHEHKKEQRTSLSAPGRALGQNAEEAWERFIFGSDPINDADLPLLHHQALQQYDTEAVETDLAFLSQVGKLSSSSMDEEMDMTGARDRKDDLEYSHVDRRSMIAQHGDGGTRAVYISSDDEYSVDEDEENSSTDLWD